MSIIPSKNEVTVITGDSGVNLDSLQTYEVPYKAPDGTLQSSGLRMLTNGSLLAPVGFSVESGSVDFGDVIRLSESAGFLAFENMVDKGRYQLVDYAVPRTGASSKPYYFKLIEAEKVFQATSGNSNVTTNPLTFEYKTQLTARTNALTFNATAKMLNVRLRITDKSSGVAVKYFPSKSSWITGQGGTTFETGNNTLDFQDTALILQAGTTLVFDIQADSISLSGSSSIPAFSGTVQQGIFIGVADTNDLANLQNQIDSVTTPFSGQYQDLKGIPSSFAPAAHTHNISEISGLGAQLSVLTNSIQSANASLSGLAIIATSGSYQDLANKPSLFSGVYADLSGKPVLFSGSYNDLTNKPTIPSTITKTSQLENDSGYINNITYPVVSVNSKTGAVILSAADIGAAASSHTHSITDITGLQNSLDSKASTSSLSGYATTDSVNSALGNYTNTQTLTNLLNGKFNVPTGNVNQYLRGDGSTATFPMIPAAQVQSDWNATSGAAFILNKPSLFSGSYSDLTNKPVLFSGSYSDLTNKPVLFDGTYASLTGKPTSFTPSAHTHVIADTTGLQAALDAKASTFSVTSALTGMRKVETFLGTSDASGNYTITFANTYTTPPDVQPQIVAGNFNQFVRIVSVSNTGCVINAAQRNTVQLLGIEVLLGATVALAGASISVQVTPRN